MPTRKACVSYTFHIQLWVELGHDDEGVGCFPQEGREWALSLSFSSSGTKTCKPLKAWSAAELVFHPISGLTPARKDTWLPSTLAQSR